MSLKLQSSNVHIPYSSVLRLKMRSPSSPVPSILPLCPEALPFITLPGTTSALNKFHCLLSYPLHQHFWALMEKITQLLRSIPIPIYGFHIHWVLTSVGQAFCSPRHRLSLTGNFKCSPCSHTSHPSSRSVTLNTKPLLLFAKKERDSLRPPYCWAVPSLLPGCPSCALDPWHLTSSHSGPSITCFCNTPVFLTVSFPPALTLGRLRYELGKK